MKRVDITITGLRRDAAGGEDVITTCAKGRRADRGGVIYVDYDEPPAAGLAGSHTLLKWYGDRLVLSRRGQVVQRQEFCVGVTSESLYQTVFMTLPVTADTYLLEGCANESFLDIYIEYALTIGGEPQGVTKLRISVQEDAKSGYKN